MSKLILSYFFIFFCSSIVAQKNDISKLNSFKNLIGYQYLDEKYLKIIDSINTSPTKENDISQMKLIKGAVFNMGADEIKEGFENAPITAKAQADEYPKHLVKLDDFYIDEHEVTVSEFLEFVTKTNYKTVAEYDIDWEMLKKQVPKGTPKPPKENLKAGALVFQYLDKNNKEDYWWSFKKGISWKNPSKDSISLNDILQNPVTQISWYDAMAYAKWCGKRLPTEAEFEYAERGGLANKMYPWGNEKISEKKCNTFQGNFPYSNSKKDGYEKTAPVKSFAPNGYGLYDMAGNVWEWTQDWYDESYYNKLKKTKQITLNPQGPNKTNDSEEPNAISKVVRGGSFLCNDNFCSGFRNARRMRLSPDSAMEHLGFRCVKSVKKNKN